MAVLVATAERRWWCRAPLVVLARRWFLAAPKYGPTSPTYSPTSLAYDPATLGF